jgi:hypothetical protein
VQKHDLYQRKEFAHSSLSRSEQKVLFFLKNFSPLKEFFFTCIRLRKLVTAYYHRKVNGRKFFFKLAPVGTVAIRIGRRLRIAELKQDCWSTTNTQYSWSMLFLSTSRTFQRRFVNWRWYPTCVKILSNISDLWLVSGCKWVRRVSAGVAEYALTYNHHVHTDSLFRKYFKMDVIF